MIVSIIKKKNPNKGIYISGVKIKSLNLGASKFWSIIFSNPLPIETSKNIWGIIPRIVAQKKLFTFTLKMHGITFEIIKGIPPMNLYTKRYINSDFLNLISRLLNLVKNFFLMVSFKK